MPFPRALPPLKAVSELAPNGVMRVGVNLGNPVVVQRDDATGKYRGIGPSLARELGGRIGASVAFVPYESAGKLAAAAKQAWDVAFLAIDPERANDIDFSAAYLHIEGAYMVRDDSPVGAIEDVDRDGVRIAVGAKTAYDLHLSRTIERASLVRTPSSSDAIARFVADDLEVVAGVRQPLVAASNRIAGLRVVPGAFMVIRQAAGVPKGRLAAHAYLARFIEESKSSGFVADAIRQSGVEGAEVAPLA